MTDGGVSEQQRLIIKLEENAMDSLVHGIEHHLYGKRQTDWKYVILHVFHAVELFLKARLAKHEETLIYNNRKNGHTVNCDEAINRLVKEVKISLSNYVEYQENGKDKGKGKYKLSGALKTLRDARYNIEHMEVSLNRDEVRNFLGVAFRFLDDFVSRELGLSLEEELEALDNFRQEELLDEDEDTSEQDSYKALSMAYLSYIRYMADRGIPLHPKEREIDHRFLTCEMCCEEAIVVPDPTSRYPRIAHCFSCRSEYKINYCFKCNEPYLSLLNEWEKGNSPSKYPDGAESIECETDLFCEACADWIDDQ